jgi:hypothetical protein
MLNLQNHLKFTKQCIFHSLAISIMQTNGNAEIITLTTRKHFIFMIRNSVLLPFTLGRKK